MKIRKLDRSFYNRPTLDVAIDLLGKVLIYKPNRKKLSGRLVEVEAYIGENDPGCHAYRGKTPRNSIMYGPPGYLYVYFTYGNHYLLNLVTEKEGFPAAVLLRAMEPLDGIPIMLRNRGVHDIENIASGPGKLAKALSITTKQYGLDVTGDIFYLVDDGFKPADIWCSPRIGLTNGGESHWRFYINSSKHISTAPHAIRHLAHPYTAEKKH